MLFLGPESAACQIKKKKKKKIVEKLQPKFSLYLAHITYVSRTVQFVLTFIIIKYHYCFISLYFNEKLEDKKKLRKTKNLNLTNKSINNIQKIKLNVCFSAV